MLNIERKYEVVRVRVAVRVRLSLGEMHMYADPSIMGHGITWNKLQSKNE